MTRLSYSLLAQLVSLAPAALAGLTVDVNDADSVKEAAALVAEDLMSFYTGDQPGEIPGVLPQPDYAFWTGGALWATLLDYRIHTGNTTFDKTILQGLLFQTAEDDDYMPANWTRSMGNDDQSFWALAAILADETGFADPATGEPQWQTLAKNIFDEQSIEERRASKCANSLRWQIFTFNDGYNYISTAANAAYFSLGAQLARTMDNQTAADLASQIYNDIWDLGLIDEDFSVYDGTNVEDDCDEINKLQFSYTAALLLEGSAQMYNYTGQNTWRTRVDGLVKRTIEVFFPDGAASDVACEPDNCNTDMTFYKAILHRSLGSTMKLAPYTVEAILSTLKTSTAAAVAQCTGGDNGRMCGSVWTGKFDGTTGAGSQMSVLGALISIMTTEATIAPTNTTDSGSGGNGTTTGDSSGPSSSTSDSATTTGRGSRAAISVGAIMGALLLGTLVLG